MADKAALSRHPSNRIAAMTVLVADDENDTFFPPEDVGKTLVKLFAEQKYSSVKKRLQSGTVTKDDLSALDSTQDSILDNAVLKSNFEIVALLLNHPDVKSIPESAGKPLYLAVKYKKFNMFSFILKTLGPSVDFDYRGPLRGNTILFEAIRVGEFEMAEALVQAGAPVNVENDDGETPLFAATAMRWTRGVELLLSANASVHHKSHNGQTPLHVAVAAGDVHVVETLLMAGAHFDVKDNRGKYPIQENTTDDVRSILRNERMTRAKLPAHIMARNGDVDGLNQWLSETTARGPGVAHVWRGTCVVDGEPTTVELKVRLVRDATNGYRCVGKYQDKDGTFYITGTWANSFIDLKKTYAHDGYTIAYGGFVDTVVGTWECKWTAGASKGNITFDIPLYDCLDCDKKVPHQHERCFACTDAHQTRVDVMVEGEEDPHSVLIALTPNADTQSYRLSVSESGSVLRGRYKDDTMHFARHLADTTFSYAATYDGDKFHGVLVDSGGATKAIRFEMEMFDCTECAAKVPIPNATCFACSPSSLHNWKGQHRATRQGEWSDFGFHMAIVRDVAQQSYQLVGEGNDEDESFDAVGTWKDDAIHVTKIYASGVVEMTGKFDGATSEWMGKCTLRDGTSEEFRVTIPMYSCFMCEASVPNVNDLCLTCDLAAPRWAPQSGKLANAWVGRVRGDQDQWQEDEFCVRIVRDPATQSYRLTGFDKDDDGFFAMTGTWQGVTIDIERQYANAKVSLHGRIDLVKSEWVGRKATLAKMSAFRYKVPTWPCPACAAPVPIEGAQCLACDKGPSSSSATPFKPPAAHSFRHEIDVREEIARLLNQMDRQDRTALMHAAQHGRPAMIETILQFMKPGDIRVNDGTGKTALDIALARKLACAQSGHDISNDDVLKCIEYVRRRSRLQIKPWKIESTLNDHVKCFGDCKRAGHSGVAKEATLIELALAKSWAAVEAQLRTKVDPEELNATDPDSRATIAHILCRDGKAKLLQLLLDQPALDLNVIKRESFYPLYEAMKNDRVECVQLLLQHGVRPTDLKANMPMDDQFTLVDLTAKCYPIFTSKVALMERDDLQDYYRANVPSIQDALAHQKAHQTALHAAVLRGQTPRIVAKLAQDALIDIDAAEKNNGDTALITAARGRVSYAEEYVKILIAHGAEVDAINLEGQTALMVAAVAGHIGIVELLLKEMADMDILDNNKQSCLDLVHQLTLSIETKGGSPHGKIKDLLHLEVQLRENSVEYRDKLAIQLMGMSAEDAFLKSGFRRAINCNPSLARTFLDDTVVVNRHNVEFSQMREIFGDDSDTSTLNAMLNLMSDDPDVVLEARQQCLEHIVTQRLLQIKWELFGLRKYIEQLTMNILLLVTSTVSSVVFDEDLTAPDGPLIVGVTAVVLTLLTLIFVQLLRPRALWRMARLFHDGSLRFDPHFDIPDLAEKKSRAKRVLFQLVVLLTGALVVPILLLMSSFDGAKYFAPFNNVVLWLTAAFFLVTELQELRAGVLKYFESNVNKAQMAIYLVIFFFFVPMKLGLISVPPTVQIGVGSFITILLWVLTVQFLEVVPSASYLLPMMGNLLQDVWNFFILFGVFQMGLTITFYQLFKNRDDEAFGTITQSFITTYFVTFGELPLDSIKSFGEDDQFLSTCAVVLIMFHAAVVVILLLNVLLAMMNKTVDSGFEKAKTEALASYAQCILRLEESMNLNKAETIELIYFKDSAGELVLNPIFNEHVPKAAMQIPDDQEAAIDAFQKKKMAWVAWMDALKADIFADIEALRKGLSHMQHFVTFDVTATLQRELALIQDVQGEIDGHIELAKKTRGQGGVVALQKLEKKVKTTLTVFEDTMLRVWNAPNATDQHKQCALLHQMTCKTTIRDLVKHLTTTIESTFEHELADAKQREAPEPSLGDLVERFDRVEETLKEQSDDQAIADNNESAAHQDLVKKMDAMAVKLDDVNRYSTSLEEKLDALMDAIVKMKR